MSIWKQTIQIRNKDVNLYQKLRTSRLMEILQEVCIAHTEALGAGRAKTLDKGFLWVIIQQEINIQRMPVYDETITVSSWPGETMHVLFPRYYQITDEMGDVIIQGSSLWTLIDKNTRRMIFADRYGITVPGEKTDIDIPLPKAIAREECDHHDVFKVPFSWCDLNGHLNNTRYFDLAEDRIQAASLNRQLTSVSAEYTSEAPFKETLDISWHEDKDHAYISGDHSKNCFLIRMTYKD